MKKFTLILLLLSVTNCKNRITGHWHVTEKENSSMITIDIDDHNDCFLILSLDSDIIKGKHYPENNHIFFPGECGIFAFKYKLKGDKLYLTNKLGTEFIGQKIDNECNRFKDYTSKLNIEHLKIKKKRNYFTPKDSIFNNHLKEFINIEYSKNDSSLRLEHSNKIHNIFSVDSIIGYINESYSESEIPYINYILTPDSNLKVKDLKLIINKLNSKSKKRVFIRTLKPNT